MLEHCIVRFLVSCIHSFYSFVCTHNISQKNSPVNHISQFWGFEPDLVEICYLFPLSCVFLSGGKRNLYAFHYYKSIGILKCVLEEHCNFHAMHLNCFETLIQPGRHWLLPYWLDLNLTRVCLAFFRREGSRTFIIQLKIRFRC